MLEPKLSIVSISFNQGNFIEECMRSVLDQNVSGLEYIVVDPGSTDNSRRVISNFSYKLGGIILEPDAGPADGLNKGFQHATGDIFGYINADDRFRLGSLEYVKNFFASNPEVDVLCGSIRIINEKGRASLRARSPDRFNLANYAAGICTVGQQGSFFRRSAFEKAGGFNVNNRTCWDGELLVDLALSGARFKTTRKVLGDFRIYATSLTGSGLFQSDRYLAERDRINAKIAQHGVRLYSPRTERIRKFLYKWDMGRHLSYILAR